MGEDVQRLHEDTEDNDGENPLRRWSTTKGICTYKVTSFQLFKYYLIEKSQSLKSCKDIFFRLGYIYKPDGLPMSSEASTYAYDAFNSIADEAERHHKGPYQKHLKRSQNRIISNHHNSSQSYISRLHTFIILRIFICT